MSPKKSDCVLPKLVKEGFTNELKKHLLMWNLKPMLHNPALRLTWHWMNWLQWTRGWLSYAVISLSPVPALKLFLMLLCISDPTLICLCKVIISYCLFKLCLFLLLVFLLLTIVLQLPHHLCSVLHSTTSCSFFNHSLFIVYLFINESSFSVPCMWIFFACDSLVPGYILPFPSLTIACDYSLFILLLSPLLWLLCTCLTLYI